MNGIHIFTASRQPATHYVDECGPTKYEGGFKPGELLYTSCCNRRRRARNCVVQCYYDCFHVWCADGKGCKNQREIQAKKRREFKRRSDAQKRRYMKGKDDARTFGV